MTINTFKQALKEGRPQLGLWGSLASPYLAEAMAIQNSAAGDGGSRSMFETPPNMCSVMSRTGMPYIFATSECAISWNSTDAKNASAAAIATASRVTTVQSGCHPPNSDERLQMTSVKIRSQLLSTRSSIPKRRPIRIALRMTL